MWFQCLLTILFYGKPTVSLNVIQQQRHRMPFSIKPECSSIRDRGFPEAHFSTCIRSSGVEVFFSGLSLRETQWGSPASQYSWILSSLSWASWSRWPYLSELFLNLHYLCKSISGSTAVSWMGKIKKKKMRKLCCLDSVQVIYRNVVAYVKLRN